MRLQRTSFAACSRIQIQQIVKEQGNASQAQYAEPKGFAARSGAANKDRLTVPESL
jgi:hypothetical protein